MNIWRIAAWPGLIAALLAAATGGAAARDLQVGPGQQYAAPSAAAAVAQDGDTVSIAPGVYYDCAQWHANRLTIAATGPGVQLTDTACAGKAAFVISGNGVRVRGLSFARIRVIDANGAGIRSEGRDLTVEDSVFINNQVGILAGNQGGFLRIARCTFSANGARWDDRQTHAVAAGALDLLRIEDSSFSQARGGDHIVSAALRTELIGNRLTDEGGAMSGPLVSIGGGVIVVDHNTVDLHAGSADRPGAVLVTGAATAITVTANTLMEPAGDVPLLRNWTGLEATENGNVVPANAAAVLDSGALYHRLRSRLGTLRSEVRDIAGFAKSRAADLVRQFKLMP
jgi:hypothetical protein